MNRDTDSEETPWQYQNIWYEDLEYKQTINENILLPYLLRNISSSLIKIHLKINTRIPSHVFTNFVNHIVKCMGFYNNYSLIYQ